MTGKNFLTTMAFALILSGPAFGDSLTSFNFHQHGNGTLGHGMTFTAGAYIVTIWGFRAMCSGDYLFSKNGSGDENGLGLTHGGADHEIGGTAFVEFSTSGIIGKHLQDFLLVGSVQTGDSWKIYGSNMLGVPGVLLLTGTSEGSINITKFANRYKYISLGAGNNDVLLSDLKVSSTVPEPGTLTLLGAGLAFLAGVVKRRVSL